MTTSPAVILLVDDDDCFRRAMAIALRLDGFRVLEAVSGQEALQRILAEHVALAVVDMLLGGEYGNDVLELIARHSPESRLASISGHPGMLSAKAKSGEATHLEKPVDPSAIIALLTGEKASTRSPLPGTEHHP